MSELERRFEAVMFPPGGRNGVISNGDLDTVAHWFAKTAIVINSSQNYRVMVPEAVRHKTAVGAPTEFDVFLGRLKNPRGLIGYGQGVNAVGLVARLDEEDRPDWLTDFRMHRLFGAQIQVDGLAVLVTYAPPDNWARPCEPLVQIWPQDRREAARWGDLPQVSRLLVDLSIVQPRWMTSRHSA